MRYKTPSESMPDLDNVIQGLECCSTSERYSRKDCIKCPYNMPNGIACCSIRQLRLDAISLLKAQQKRIKELEELLYKGGCDGLNACSVKSCPYYNASHVRMEETRAAIILELQAENEKLKAQINDLQTAKTPRVMTLEEVKEWAEMSILERQKRKPMFCEKRTGECGWVHNPAIPKDYYIYALDGQCRYWTDQPTDEQREAMPWG